MKTKIYVLVAIIIFGIIATNFTKKSNSTHRILIQSTDSEISSSLLFKSAQIITNRLKSFSSEKFDIITIPEKNQIQVILSNNWDIKTTENLITQKGTLEFYETYNFKNLVELLKDESKIVSLLHGEAPSDSSAKIGCISYTEVNKVNEYLNSLEINQQCKFVWSNFFENSDVCLYALRQENGNGVLLGGTDIESFKFKNDTIHPEYYIEFKFEKSVVQLWSDITKRNINNAIAVVLDNYVIFAPVVRSEINEGNCQITGDFTQDQVRYIAAIGDNGELPISFKVVK